MIIILISLSSITLIQNVKCSTTLIPTIGSTPTIDGVIDQQNNEWGSAEPLFISKSLITWTWITH
ncbi:MAG: hypothetical protein ACTSPN_12780 [Promethearchaeota archaeon]